MSIRRHLTIVLTLAALATLTVSCGAGSGIDPEGDAAYRAALPLAASVSLDVPSDAGNGALALGTRAELFTLTRGASGAVNGYAGLLLTWLKLISLSPPSESGDDYRVWGPSEPKGTEVLSWRLRVDKQSDSLFTFLMEARPKGSTAEEDFQSMIEGEVTPGDEAFHSLGNMTLNFDNYQAVGGPDPCPLGLIHVGWDASTSTRTVDVTWENFQNTCKDVSLADAAYHYAQEADYSGEFEFETTDNIHVPAANKPGLESLKMKSRWTADGAGRSDVALTGDEIAADLATLGLGTADVHVTQCWDELFALTYADSSPDEFEALLFEEMGDPTACVFDTAEYPTW